MVKALTVGVLLIVPLFRGPFTPGILVDAHGLGLHGLGGETPSGPPDLPEITGAFELELQASVISGSHRWQSLFHWSNADASESIWLGYRQKGDMKGLIFETIVGGTVTKCQSTGQVAPAKQLFAYKVVLQADGGVELFHKGLSVTNCPGIGIPANTARGHYIGTSLFDGVDPERERLDGFVNGIRVTNLGTPQHPRDALLFLNFPGQSFGTGFVASFFARFDDTTTRSNQKVFDFGNGDGVDNIRCGQSGTSNDMACQALDPGGTYRTVVAPGTIVEDEWAFWHFGVDAGGTFWVQKDTGTVISAPHGVLPATSFRRLNLVGSSHTNSDSDMQGAVVGLRLDRLPIS